MSRIIIFVSLLLLRFLGICLAADQEPTIKVNVKDHSNVVSDKFLSYSIDPKLLLANDDLLINNDALCMAKSLSPAYIRIAGPSTNSVTFDSPLVTIKSKLGAEKADSRIRVTTSNWETFLKWAHSVDLVPFFALNHEERTKMGGRYEPKTALKVMSAAERTSDGEVIWQMGYECKNQSLTQYLTDLTTLKGLVDAYPSGKKGIWHMVGSDVTNCVDVNDSEGLKNYLLQSNNILDAVFISGTGSLALLDALNDDDRNAVDNELTKTQTPLWYSIKPNESDVYQDEDEKAIAWINDLGSAASNGVNVLFKELRMEEIVEPSMAYYVSVIHKKLVGERVLELKMSDVDMSGNKNVKMYAHCTSLMGKPVSGAVTLFGANPNANNSKISVKLSGREPAGEIMQYILKLDKDGNILVNGAPMYYAGDLRPAVKSVRPFKSLIVNLPPKSVGFWVIANSKVPACKYNDDELNTANSDNLEHRPPIKDKPAQQLHGILLKELKKSKNREKRSTFLEESAILKRLARSTQNHKSDEKYKLSETIVTDHGDANSDIFSILGELSEFSELCDKIEHKEAKLLSQKLQDFTQDILSVYSEFGIEGLKKLLSTLKMKANEHARIKRQSENVGNIEIPLESVNTVTRLEKDLPVEVVANESMEKEQDLTTIEVEHFDETDDITEKKRVLPIEEGEQENKIEDIVSKNDDSIEETENNLEYAKNKLFKLQTENDTSDMEQKSDNKVDDQKITNLPQTIVKTRKTSRIPSTNENNDNVKNAILTQNNYKKNTDTLNQEDTIRKSKKQTYDISKAIAVDEIEENKLPHHLSNSSTSESSFKNAVDENISNSKNNIKSEITKKENVPVILNKRDQISEPMNKPQRQTSEPPELMMASPDEITEYKIPYSTFSKTGPKTKATKTGKNQNIKVSPILKLTKHKQGKNRPLQSPTWEEIKERLVSNNNNNKRTNTPLLELRSLKKTNLGNRNSLDTSKIEMNKKLHNANKPVNVKLPISKVRTLGPFEKLFKTSLQKSKDNMETEKIKSNKTTIVGTVLPKTEFKILGKDLKKSLEADSKTIKNSASGRNKQNTHFAKMFQKDIEDANVNAPKKDHNMIKPRNEVSHKYGKTTGSTLLSANLKDPKSINLQSPKFGLPILHPNIVRPQKVTDLDESPNEIKQVTLTESNKLNSMKRIAVNEPTLKIHHLNVTNMPEVKLPTILGKQLRTAENSENIKSKNILRTKPMENIRNDILSTQKPNTTKHSENKNVLMTKLQNHSFKDITGNLGNKIAKPSVLDDQSSEKMSKTNGNESKHGKEIVSIKNVELDKNAINLFRKNVQRKDTHEMKEKVNQMKNAQAQQMLPSKNEFEKPQNNNDPQTESLKHRLQDLGKRKPNIVNTKQTFEEEKPKNEITKPINMNKEMDSPKQEESVKRKLRLPEKGSIHTLDTASKHHEDLMRKLSEWRESIQKKKPVKRDTHQLNNCDKFEMLSKLLERQMTDLLNYVHTTEGESLVQNGDNINGTALPSEKQYVGGSKPRSKRSPISENSVIRIYENEECSPDMNTMKNNDDKYIHQIKNEAVNEKILDSKVNMDAVLNKKTKLKDEESAAPTFEENQSTNAQSKSSIEKDIIEKEKETKIDDKSNDPINVDERYLTTKKDTKLNSLLSIVLKPLISLSQKLKTVRVLLF